MSLHELQNPAIEGNDRYLEKLNQCQQIISDLSPMVALGYGYKQFYADDLYWNKDVSQENWLPPAGDWDNVDWPTVMERNMPDGAEIACVPEYLLRLWQDKMPDRIEIVESRDQWDYILYPNRVEEMEGKVFRSFRQNANKFRKTYDNVEIVPITQENLPELLAFHEASEKELQERVDNLAEAEREDQAIRRMLQYWGDPRSHLFGFMVKVDGQIASAVINERLNEFASIGIYQKNNYDFKGINAFSTLTDAQLQKDMGIMTINIMQDEGVENLRNAKEHLSPLVYIRKYTVYYHSPDPAASNSAEETWTKGILKLTRITEKGDIRFMANGRITTDNADLLEEKMLESCGLDLPIRLDMRGLKYICSSGLRVLLEVFREKGKDGFIICGVSDFVKEILEMVGYDQILSISDEGLS